MEDRANKKTRILENTVVSAKVATATDNARYGNFKTQLCVKYRLGYCQYGSKCLFAHGVDDLRNRVPNFCSVAVSEDRVRGRECGVADGRNLCRMFYRRNEKCCSRHVTPERGRTSAISTRTGGFSEGNASVFRNLKPMFKKKKLCTSWEVSGICRYGKLCHYAHGLAELGMPAGYIAPGSKVAPTNASTTLPLGKQGSSQKQELHDTKCLSTWKATGKIIGIYADWIEDAPFGVAH